MALIILRNLKSMFNKSIHQELVKGLKSGSCRDFNKLYIIYADLLYGFILSLTKSETDAKDILQESFLRVWENREGLSIDTSFKCYLFTIARHLIIDSFRKKINCIDFEDFICSHDYQELVETAADEKLYYDDLLRELEVVKTKMTGRQKEIFDLRRDQNYSISKIANELHISEKTVINHLSSVLKRIKLELSLIYR